MLEYLGQSTIMSVTYFTCPQGEGTAYSCDDLTFAPGSQVPAPAGVLSLLPQIRAGLLVGEGDPCVTTVMKPGLAVNTLFLLGSWMGTLVRK